MDKKLNSGPAPVKVKPGQMPSPPEFLTRPDPTEGTTYPTMIEEHIPAAMPQSIDFGIYQNAVNDRKQAEMSAAEIYSQYLQVVTFNQRLLRTQRIFDRFKERVRKVYNRAMEVDGEHSELAQRAKRHQMAVERAYNDLQIESEGLRASNRVHEEAYGQMLRKLGQAEAQMEQANHQFQTLAEEFDNRGILLEEADRHIQNYRTQISQFEDSLREWHDKYSKIRDENMLLKGEIRDLQMREAGIAALNNELANSATKAQKQIFELEDKLTRETEESRARISVLEAEVDRYREQKRVEALLEKSKKIQTGEKIIIAPELHEKDMDSSQDKRTQWNEFYNKWSHIINELTTHSSSPGLRPPSMEGKSFEETLPPLPDGSVTGELISEAGELEIL